MRSRALIVLLIAGCSGEPAVTQNASATSADVAPKPAPAPPDEPFDSPEEIAAWQSRVQTLADTYAAAPDPELEIAKLDAFPVDTTVVGKLASPPETWKAGYRIHTDVDLDHDDGLKPSKEEAARLEAADQEFVAGQMYVDLGLKADAARCADTLEAEGEWNAVAVLAIHLDDLARLEKAVVVMEGGGQLSRLESLVSRALEAKKPAAAEWLAKRFKHPVVTEITADTVRMMTHHGDASLLPALIEYELKSEYPEAARVRIEAFDWREHGARERIVEDIVVLSRTDRAKAKEYAKAYLAMRSANTVGIGECGEGCYFTAARGTLELYQLMRDDAEAKALYLERTRQWFTDTAQTGGSFVYSGQEELWGSNGLNAGFTASQGNDLYALLAEIRTLKDPALVEVWEQNLATIGKEAPIARELGRLALGLSWNPDAEDLEPSDRRILRRIAGKDASAPAHMPSEWSRYNLDALAFVLCAGRPEETQTEINGIVRAAQDALETRGRTSHQLESALQDPYLVPRLARAEADAIVAPVLPHVRAKAPRTYEWFVVHRAQDGDHAYFEAYTKDLTAAGDADGVTRLTAMLSSGD